MMSDDADDAANMQPTKKATSPPRPPSPARATDVFAADDSGVNQQHNNNCHSNGHSNSLMNNHTNNHTNNHANNHTNNHTHNHTNNPISNHTNNHSNNHTNNLTSNHTNNLTSNHSNNHTNNHSNPPTSNHINNLLQNHHQSPNHAASLDSVSISSVEHQQLLQTTQSLLMASSMMHPANPYAATSSLFGSNESMNYDDDEDNDGEERDEEGDDDLTVDVASGGGGEDDDALSMGSGLKMHTPPLPPLPLTVSTSSSSNHHHHHHQTPTYYAALGVSGGGGGGSSSTMPAGQPATTFISLDELLREIHMLRSKLREVTTDRDRLLCEVSNLRLEMDMGELKRLRGESFPQKAIDRNGSAQYVSASSAGLPAGSITSGSSMSTDGGGVAGGNVGVVGVSGAGAGAGAPGSGGYVYLQHHYVPSSVSSSSASSINYPQSHMIYQHHHAAAAAAQQYPTCHQQQQQQQIIHHPGTGLHYAQHLAGHPHAMLQHSQQSHHHHHHMMHSAGGGVVHHPHHHGGAVVIAGSGVGTGFGVSTGGGSTSPSAAMAAAAAGMQQNLHKKNSIRGSGEVLKRSRAQAAYELSQDLLEKQIELLERKYGGVRARNASIIIQRAFRHYMMVKKFASITAMAKAEKRLSRRGLVVSASESGAGGSSSLSASSAYGSATESQLDCNSQQQQQQMNQQQQQQPRVTIMAGPPSGSGSMQQQQQQQGQAGSAQSRTPPTRSLSMRERRQVDGSPIPRSQSGASSVSGASSSVSSSSLVMAGSQSAHPHVNLLHAAESHYYSSAASSLGATSALYYPTSYHGHQAQQQQQLDASFASSANSSQHLDSSPNASWVGVGGSSPHTPYYSAAQIYMRPKVATSSGASTSSSGSMTPTDRKKVPPEVPKRTSSITAQQHAQHMEAAAQAAVAAYQQKMMLQQQQRQTPPPSVAAVMRSNGLCKTAENGSLTSVQSSGSDSSVTSVERMTTAANSDLGSDRSNSPNTWKRGTHLNSSQQYSHDSASSSSYHGGVGSSTALHVGMSGLASAGGSSMGSGSLVTIGQVTAAAQAQDDHAVSSHTSAAQYEQHHGHHPHHHTQQQLQQHQQQQQQMQQQQQQLQQQQQQQEQELNTSGASTASQNYKISETIRKRQYRVGLNLFNKKPEKGITYLIRRGFLENTPQGVARFLISRKGLSRQMIGEYLGNLQNQFNMAVLGCFALELDLSGMQVDVALRKFQAYFRMPGEAQKIERLMEIFSHRYCQCNQDIVARLRSSDTIFVLAFAIIMLNTDLHTPNLKPERRMRVEDFVKNLRGIDDCHDIDKDMLHGIYERVKANEFKPGSDHVTQVMKVQSTIAGKKPNLALPHRRLVCYCRLYEIPDVNKKERPGVHQREVFLFNDLLVITKIFSKKKSYVTYTFRNSFPLSGMVVSLLDVPNYAFCIQLSQKVDGKILITFNARNEHDRCKFAEDLKESISEMDEMEALRIEAELERQKSARNRSATGNSENRDSGVADVEVCPCPYQGQGPPGEHAMPNAMHGGDSASQQLKRSALSNSLLDMHEQFGNDKPQRRGSVGSLDSGMSISFQSTTTSSASRENAAAIAAAANAAAAKMRYAAVGIQQQQQLQQQLPPSGVNVAAVAVASAAAGGGMMYVAAPAPTVHGGSSGTAMHGYATQPPSQPLQQQQQQQHHHAPQPPPPSSSSTISTSAHTPIPHQHHHHQHQHHNQLSTTTHPTYTIHATTATHQTQTILIQQQIGQPPQPLQQPQPPHVPLQQTAATSSNSSSSNVMQPQPPQQQPLTGRIPGRERKQSRSDENGRSTEV